MGLCGVGCIKYPKSRTDTCTEREPKKNPIIVIMNGISAAEFPLVSGVGRPVGIEMDAINFTMGHIGIFNIWNTCFGYDNE